MDNELKTYDDNLFGHLRAACSKCSLAASGSRSYKLPALATRRWFAQDNKANRRAVLQVVNPVKLVTKPIAALLRLPAFTSPPATPTRLRGALMPSETTRRVPVINFRTEPSGCRPYTSPSAIERTRKWNRPENGTDRKMEQTRNRLAFPHTQILPGTGRLR